MQVTYMLKGAFKHEDFCGHKGTIFPGDLQWMTAGRGIVHCEMPAGDGDNVGLQLWINLKAEYKVLHEEWIWKVAPQIGQSFMKIATSCNPDTPLVYCCVTQCQWPLLSFNQN